MTHAKELIKKCDVSLSQGRQLKELLEKIRNCETYHAEQQAKCIEQDAFERAQFHYGCQFAQRDIRRQLEAILNS